MEPRSLSPFCETLKTCFKSTKNVFPNKNKMLLDCCFFFLPCKKSPYKWQLATQCQSLRLTFSSIRSLMERLFFYPHYEHTIEVENQAAFFLPWCITGKTNGLAGNIFLSHLPLQLHCLLCDQWKQILTSSISFQTIFCPETRECNLS